MGSPQPSRSSSQHASRAARREPVSISISDRKGSRPITCRAGNASRSAIVCWTTERIASSRKTFQALRKLAPIRVSHTKEEYHVMCRSAGKDPARSNRPGLKSARQATNPVGQCINRRRAIDDSLPCMRGEPWATNPRNRRAARANRNNRRRTTKTAVKQRLRSRRRHSARRSECRRLRHERTPKPWRSPAHRAARKSPSSTVRDRYVYDRPRRCDLVYVSGHRVRSRRHERRWETPRLQ